MAFASLPFTFVLLNVYRPPPQVWLGSRPDERFCAKASELWRLGATYPRRLDLFICSQQVQELYVALLGPATRAELTASNPCAVWNDSQIHLQWNRCWLQILHHFLMLVALLRSGAGAVFTLLVGIAQT